MWLFTNGHCDLKSINKKYINELYKISLGIFWFIFNQLLIESMDAKPVATRANCTTFVSSIIVESHSVVSDSAHQDCSPWNSLDKNSGVSCYSLLQGIFLTQGSNLGLLNCRQILYYLSHQGNPNYCWTFGLFQYFGHINQVYELSRTLLCAHMQVSLWYILTLSRCGVNIYTYCVCLHVYKYTYTHTYVWVYVFIHTSTGEWMIFPLLCCG